MNWNSSALSINYLNIFLPKELLSITLVEITLIEIEVKDDELKVSFRPMEVGGANA